MKNALKYLTASCLVFCFSNGGFAQDAPKSVLKNLVDSLNAYTTRLSPEALYVQTDKSSYAAGDTLWFKAYLFNAPALNTPLKSGLLYIELSSDSSGLVKRMMVPLYGGVMFGNIDLDETLKTGGYVLRAYTNWMLNHGEKDVFKKRIYIGDVSDKEWLINYASQVTKKSGKDHVDLKLKFNQWDKIPVGYRDFQLQLTDGKNVWSRNKVQTEMDGTLDLNFDIPERVDPGNISIIAQDLRKGQGERKLDIPVVLNRPDRIDLQFMPEGGYMISSITSRIAFKAINEDGKAADVSGKVYDSKGSEVAAFESSHKGMGSIYLLPLAGESYSARIALPDGSYKSYPLPAAKPSGTSMIVTNHLDKDSLDLIIAGTPDTDGKTYSLIGMSRGMATYGASFKLKNGAVKVKIDKSVFSTGMARLVVTDADKRILNERHLYIDHKNGLKISIAANKPFYTSRDSVSLDLTVKNAEGLPVQGSFSLAVTDNGQVKTDSLSGTIVSTLLLSANLKGTVEEPGYYLNADQNDKKWQHLDDLLLTQGWTAYDWDEAFLPIKPLKYKAEAEFAVEGKVTNIFNKPVAGSGINLFSKKPLLVMDTVTNKDGFFSFKGIIPVDTAIFFVQARNKRGKSFNVGIEMEQFKPPVFTEKMMRVTPWYVNVDTTDLMFANQKIEIRKVYERVTGKSMLKEVIINAKKTVRDSKNLNGPGGADIIVDQKELEKAGTTSLWDLLVKHVKGLHVKADKAGNLGYYVNDKTVELIIDGVDTKFFRDPDPKLIYQDLKGYFDYYDAAEIKGIEVMLSTKYQMSYTTRYQKPLDLPWDFAFIEVTTRGGKGPLMKKSTGTAVYRPLPLSLPKLFYAPKYVASSKADGSDVRSTIHWEPNIVTDKDGNATLSFYTSDNKGSYTVIVEGTDMSGGLGVARSVITVK